MNKLFKKSVAVIASMGVLATTVNVNAFAASLVNAEFTAAYEWMKESNATTMPTEEAFLPYNNVTREQAPKMMINGLMAGGVELNKVRDYNLDFSDLTSADPSLQADIIKGYEYGLVNGWNGEYHPRDVVNRAQVMTILGRALYGQLPESAEYWKNYYKLLNTEGIFTIENAQAPIKRYELALVLYRVANLDRTANNETVDQLLCEVLGKEDCKKDDKKDDTDTNTDPVAKGDLDVSVANYSSAVKTAPKGIFVANEIKFDASEDMTLETLTLKRGGLSTRTDIEKVWLERNGVAVTNAASVSSDGYVTLNFKNGKNKVTRDSKTQNFELVIQISKDADTGNEVSFELEKATASAKNIKVSGTTTSYRISGYKVVELDVEGVNANPVTYKLGNQSDYVIGQFALQSDSNSDDRDINVRSITFRNYENLDFASTFKNVRVYRDSKVVSNGVEVNGRDITITLDKDVIKANRRATYTIRAEVANLEQVGQSVQLQIRNKGDIITDEADTGFRANVDLTGDRWAKVKNANGAEEMVYGLLAKYTFDGGRVVFETQKNFPKTIEAGAGSNDVVVAAGKISTNENVQLPTITISYTGSYATPGAHWATDAATKTGTIKRLVLEVDNTRYTANNDKGVFKFDNVYVRKTSDVKLLMSLDSKAKTGTVKFPSTLSNVLMSGFGEYQTNSENLKNSDIAGAINIATVLIKEPKFQLTSNNIATQTTLVGDSSVKTLMSGKLASKDKDIAVNEFTVKVFDNDPLKTGNFVDVYLDVNGQAFSNATLTKESPSFTFNSLGTIKAGSDMPFEIKVQPNTQTGQDLVLVVQAKGTDSNGNSAETTQDYSATLEIKAKASIEVTNVVDSTNRVVEPTVNTVLYEGTLNVTAGSTELNSFALTATTGANVTSIEKYKLYIDGEWIADSDNASFTDLHQNLEEGKRNVTVKANVKTSTSATSLGAYEYKITQVSVNNDPYTRKSNTYFAKGFFKLNKKSENNGVLTLTLTNDSPNTIEIEKLTLNATGDVATASVNGQVVDTNNNGEVAPQLVSAGSSIEIQVIAKKDKLVRLEGVQYKVTDGDDKYTYELTKDNTSVGNWGTFFSNM